MYLGLQGGLGRETQITESDSSQLVCLCGQLTGATEWRLKGEGLRRRDNEQVGTLHPGCHFAGAPWEIHETEAQLSLTSATQEGPEDGTNGLILMRVGQPQYPEVLRLSFFPHCHYCQSQMVQSLGTRETGNHSYMCIPLDYLPGSQAEEINILKKIRNFQMWKEK